MKKATCIGINNYPGTSNDLQGCVNDANDWSSLLMSLGFEVTVMLDAQATRQNVKAALNELVSTAKAGDVAVFTYSGHGTQVFDTSGDESDTYDEAIYVHDGTIVDDELRSILKQIDPLATLIIISDSCFSGTVTRIAPEPARPRYMPLSLTQPIGKLRNRFLLPEADLPEILLSGCTDSEFSYDAFINGRYNGAMTAMAISVIKQNPQVTYKAFYESLRKLLPTSAYPQTPQLEGSSANKDRILFEPLAVAPVPNPTPDPSPTPAPTPSPESAPGCITSVIQQVMRFFKE